MNVLAGIAPLFAQAMGGYSVIQTSVFVIVLIAAVAIVVVITRQMGVAIPPFIVNILWILLAAFVGIFALVMLFNMVGRM